MGGDPNPGVTNQELHILLVEIHGDLKALASSVDRQVKEDTIIHQDFEDRMRKSEKFRWMTTGGAALVTTVVGIVIFIMKT